MPLQLKARFTYRLAEFLTLRRPDHLHIDSLAQVLHCLAKHAVVHQFVEILFEGALCLLAELSVFVDMGFHALAPFEAERPVDIFEAHAKLPVKLQIPVAENVAGLVAQVRHQLFYLVRRTPYISCGSSCW